MVIFYIVYKRRFDRLFPVIPVMLMCSLTPFQLLAQQNARKSTSENLRTGIQLTNVKQIARLTGDPLPGESIPSPNNTAAHPTL